MLYTAHSVSCCHWCINAFREDHAGSCGGAAAGGAAEGNHGGDVFQVNFLQGQAHTLGNVVHGLGGFLQIDSGQTLRCSGSLLRRRGDGFRFHGNLGLIHNGDGQLGFFQCFQLGEEPDIENAQHSDNAAQKNDQNQQKRHKTTPAFWGLGGAGAVDTVIPGMVQILIIAIIHRVTS